MNIDPGKLSILLYSSLCLHLLSFYACMTLFAFLRSRSSRRRTTWRWSTTRRWCNPWRSWTGSRGSSVWSEACWRATCSTGEPKPCPSERYVKVYEWEQWCFKRKEKTNKQNKAKKKNETKKKRDCKDYKCKFWYVNLFHSILETDPQFGFEQAKQQLQGKRRFMLHCSRLRKRYTFIGMYVRLLIKYRSNVNS